VEDFMVSKTSWKVISFYIFCSSMS